MSNSHVDRQKAVPRVRCTKEDASKLRNSWLARTSLSSGTPPSRASRGLDTPTENLWEGVVCVRICLYTLFGNTHTTTVRNTLGNTVRKRRKVTEKHVRQRSKANGV